MKILMVNKFYYVKGGSETYYFALKRLLEENGHQVIDFSMEDERNYESPYSRFFVKNVDYSATNGIFAKIQTASNIIYSREAKKKFKRLIEQEMPDLVHLHMFQHQISPSILDVIKKYEIPTVYTAHDLKMICLNYKMMHHDRVCEDCKGGKYYKCAKNRCVKQSFSKSLINMAEGYLHKWRRSYDAINVVITPSAFYKQKFEEFGVNESRVIHIPNFLDKEMPLVNEKEDAKSYYLYFGRLSEEKGILTLIKAVENSDMTLYIVGSGPLREELEAYIKERNVVNIKLLGFMSGQELTDIVGNAKAVVLPSEWYENGPYSAIEALQLGRPIIGADIGGIPELISGNGYLFESGNVDELKDALCMMESATKQVYEDMEKASVEMFEKTYTQEVHFAHLRKAYEQAGIKI